MLNSTSEVNALNEIYRELALLIGEENAFKVFEEYKGQQITFPMKWYSVEHVTIVATEMYDGGNLKILAKQFGYSERWLRQIIKKAEQ